MNVWQRELSVSTINPWVLSVTLARFVLRVPIQVECAALYKQEGDARHGIQCRVMLEASSWAKRVWNSCLVTVVEREVAKMWMTWIVSLCEGGIVI